MDSFMIELPSQNQELTVELQAVREIASKCQFADYTMTSNKYFDSLGSWEDLSDYLKDRLEEATPVGTIDFVQSYLKKVHGVCEMHPIEVPERLRIPKMLLRDYQFVKRDNLPTEGNWFIKNVSGLKKGTYCGDAKKLNSASNYMEMNEDDIFQVSTILDIMSEYRVFVYKDKIVGIQYYDGNVLVMPTPQEIKKIQEAVVRYSVAHDCPDAYTMDWAIINTGCKKEPRDIAILEVHPFVSVGTYGLEGPVLLNMYKHGIQWYIKHNTPLMSE